MILPIIAYGHPVLKKKAKEVPNDYAQLEVLLENMWETMYNANGVGLAAPQVGLSYRIFLVDTEQVFEEKEKGIKQAFINATIIEEEGKLWAYEEGCLSIPHIKADIDRLSQITIEYYDEDFKKQTKTFDGMNARVIQHEYDHIEGKLFTEKIKPLKKRFIKRKLEAIKAGKVKADYRLKFYKG